MGLLMVLTQENHKYKPQVVNEVTNLNLSLSCVYKESTNITYSVVFFKLNYE